MFENLFRGKKGASTRSPEQLNPKERMRAIEGSSTAELAAVLEPSIARIRSFEFINSGATPIAGFRAPNNLSSMIVFIRLGS